MQVVSFLACFGENNLYMFKTRKNHGPKIEPCGIPDIVSWEFDQLFISLSSNRTADEKTIMAKRQRDLIAIIFKNFIDSLKPRKFYGELKGTDHFGTKYYEIPPGGNRRKRSRYFEPIGDDKFDQEIPAEWESWLRGRRIEPPSQEEVMRNYNLALEKKKKALEIEEKFKGKKEELPVLAAAKGKASFPVYPEYEVSPGKPPDEK